MEDQNCGVKEGEGGGRGTPGSGQTRSEKGGSNQYKDTYSEGAIGDRMSIPNQVETCPYPWKRISLYDNMKF